MLVLLCNTHHLGDLGLGNLKIVHAADTLAFGMNLKHDLCGAGSLHTEDGLEDIDHELHRREIVIYQNDTVQ
jgi:hypothetical protein